MLRGCRERWDPTCPDQHGVQEKPAITYPGEFSPPRLTVHIPALARCQRTSSY